MTEAETLKKSREEAKEEGIEIGEARGEEKKAIEMAKKMLADNKPIAEIVKYTELTAKQIEQLKL